MVKLLQYFKFCDPNTHLLHHGSLESPASLIIDFNLFVFCSIVDTIWCLVGWLTLYLTAFHVLSSTRNICGRTTWSKSIDLFSIKIVPTIVNCYFCIAVPKQLALMFDSFNAFSTKTNAVSILQEQYT